MWGEVSEVFDALLKGLQADQLGNLILAGIILMVIWIYREVRNSLIEVEKLNTERLDKALIIYGELKVSLLSFKKNDTIQIGQKFANSYPFFNRELLKKAICLEKDLSDQGIDDFILVLESEVLRLKSLQSDPISRKPSGYFFDEIEYFLSKTKFSSFFQPILFLFMAFIIVAVISTFTLKYEKSDVYGKIQLFFLFADTISHFVFIATFIELLIDCRFKHTLYNWLRVCGLVIMPGVAFWVLRYNWLLVANLILVWIFFIYFFRDSTIA